MPKRLITNSGATNTTLAGKRAGSYSISLIPKMESTSPTINEPESPIKIFAGEKL